MLLPLPNAETAVLVESDRTGVVNMGVAPYSGLLIRLLVEEPMDSRDVAKPSVVPRELGFDPCDLGELVLLSKNASPEVAMLVTMDRSPLEGAVKSVRDIPTVGEEVNAASCGLNCLKDCCDLPSLGSLPGPQNGSMGPVSIEED